MAKDCCPEPADLWLFRAQSPSQNGPVYTYTVPEKKILIVNSWVIGASQSFDLRRNAEIVASFVSNGEPRLVNQVFPTGIVLFAGDTLTVDLSNINATSMLYGYLQKA